MWRRRDILFVSSNFPPVIGGSSVVYDQICRKAADRVVALGASHSHEGGEKLAGTEANDASCGYLITRIRYLRPQDVTKGRHPFSRLWAYVTNDAPVMLNVLANLVWLIARHRVNVVCLGELVYNGWLVFPLRYILRRTVIIYTHGEEISQDDGGFLSTKRGAFLRHAHRIISVSLFCKSLIVSKYNIRPEKIHIVSNGVDLETFSRGVADRGILPADIRHKKIVLAVSRLVARKGHEPLLQAMSLVLRDVPDAHCVIVGTGPLADRLGILTDRLNLRRSVTFLGGVSFADLAKLYRVADVFALPCRTLSDGDTEGFGLVFLEANACGVAVVAGAAGGTIEAVIDGETGLIVDSNQPAQIAAAITRILNDGALARYFGETGWRRAQEWDWSAVTQRFLQTCQADSEDGGAFAYPVAPPAISLEPTVGAPVRAGRQRLLVTVDVEEEFSWSSYDRADYKIRGLDELMVFHTDCQALGVCPIYLVTYPIMMDPAYCHFLRQALAEGSAEVGVHLHAWVTPPFWEHANVFNSYQCNLPSHVEQRKLETMCRTFEDKFGFAARAHRAGRWGGAERTTMLLEDLGVSVDLSPLAGYSDGLSGHPDFRNLGGAPFWSGRNNNTLVCPASTLNYLPGPTWVSKALFSFIEKWPNTQGLATLFDGFGKPVRFSPDGLPIDSLKSIARQLAVRQLPVVVFSVHSTSFYAGGNPYAPDVAAAIALRARSSEVLRYCIEDLAMQPSNCAEIYRVASGSPATGQVSGGSERRLADAYVP
jgi:phosphatidylinositol alpha-1,6-mannosyltransferase